MGDIRYKGFVTTFIISSAITYVFHIAEYVSTRILSYKKQLIRNTSGISGNNKKQALVNPKTLRNIALVKMAVRNICSFSNSHLMQHDLNSSWFLECIYQFCSKGLQIYCKMTFVVVVFQSASSFLIRNTSEIFKTKKQAEKISKK